MNPFQIVDYEMFIDLLSKVTLFAKSVKKYHIKAFILTTQP